MNFKKTFLALTICLCFSQATVTEETKQKKFFGKMGILEKIEVCTKKTIKLIRDHPFLTAGLLAIIFDKKIRKNLFDGPRLALEDLQKHPILTIVFAGLALNYGLNSFDLETR